MEEQAAAGRLSAKQEAGRQQRRRLSVCFMDAPSDFDDVERLSPPTSPAVVDHPGTDCDISGRAHHKNEVSATASDSDSGSSGSDLDDTPAGTDVARAEREGDVSLQGILRSLSEVEERVDAMSPGMFAGYSPVKMGVSRVRMRHNARRQRRSPDNAMPGLGHAPDKANACASC